MDISLAKECARESGFEYVEELNVDGLEFREDIRAMCNAEHCQQGYGKSWSCPPEAPPLEELRAKAKKYNHGIIVQTIGQLEDSLDFEGIVEAGARHTKAFNALADRLIDETDGQVLPLGAGSCTRCPSCSYPDEPCRYPDKLITSMESSGLYVAEVCKSNGLEYNNGANTMTYTSCCLF